MALKSLINQLIAQSSILVVPFIDFKVDDIKLRDNIYPTNHQQNNITKANSPEEEKRK